MMIFGERLKELRESQGISQSELARRIGVSRSAICNYENGRREKPSAPVVYAIAEALNVTPKDFEGSVNTVELCSPDVFDFIKQELKKQKSSKRALAEYLNVFESSLNAAFRRKSYSFLIKDDRIVKTASFLQIRASDLLGKVISGENDSQQAAAESNAVTFNGYQNLARRTQNGKLNPCERRMHALHGLASEVGEIHALYQKTFQGHPLNADSVVDELGDLLWFAAELADVLGVSLETVAALNICKLQRRYPEGFDVEHSMHREEE